ncbi:D-methionine transport system permease protein [Desulfitispora alkaliphila]|uniref:methionine ABC transporter permease n=1 Tax=Desulfitispora alkaliphila TaxID=622674 RepID=UPI003D252EBF
MSFDTIVQIMLTGTWETILMVGVSVILSHLVGVPLGVIVVITRKGHILENKLINSLLGAVVNLGRSVPFIILLVALIPFTQLLMGTFIGIKGVIVPLTIAAIPFVARMVETSLLEVPKGLIEAAQAMGATPLQIIFKVLLPESLSSLILGATITTVNLIGYSAMAGFVGGGGLGDIGIRYGYYRYDSTIMLITVVLLVIMVQGIQLIGEKTATSLNKK